MSRLYRLPYFFLTLGVFSFLISCQAESTDKSLPDLSDKSLLYETFDKGWEDRWIHSENSKYSGRFVTDQPSTWPHSGLKVPEKSQHYGISTLLRETLDASIGVVVQYAVKFTDGITCGGAYVKLITYLDFKPQELKDDTLYTIMFGPDKCGSPGKVHLILRRMKLVDDEQTYVEHHLKDPPVPVADSNTHLYTLRIWPDNRFEIWIDGESKAKGSLLEKLEPPLVAPKTIPDPLDVKPADWVDDAEIPDSSAVKPDDWEDDKVILDSEAKKPAGWLDNEPPTINDPAAKTPSEWDEEEDGVWVPPKIANPKCKKAGCGTWKRPTKANPKYKGEWSAPLVPNPDYKGSWVQRTIANPEYVDEPRPLSHLAYVGGLALEIWTVDEGYTFGGFLLTYDAATANEYRDKVFKPIQAAEKAADKAKLARESAEREAKAKSKGALPKDAPQSHLQRVAGTIIAFLNRPTFERAAPFLAPLISVLKTRPEVIFGLVAAATGLTLVSLLFSLFFGGKKELPRAPRRARTAGRAKKEDLTSDDDEDDEVGEAKAEQRAAEDATADEPADDPPAISRCPFAGAAATAEEIKDEDEDDEEPSKVTRRKVPRAD